MSLDDWFLTASERGNLHTGLDRRRDGAAWTEGNDVEVLVDGTAYFERLYTELASATDGDTVLFTGLEGSADERLLRREGSEIGRVLCESAERGVAVHGLVWRSHAFGYSETANLLFTRAVNDAGGEVMLDHRVRRGGSHHQKIVIVRHAASPETDIAFVGGIDMAHGRHDDRRHHGDEQAADLAEVNYGDQPPWHDVQVAVRGPAVDDVAFTFRERWEDPTPLDRRTPWRWALQHLSKRPSVPSHLPPERDDPMPVGACAIQVLRTYPARRPRYPFAPDGERSIGRAYVKAFRRARRLVYLEDQYLWSFRAAEELCNALRREPELLVVIVVPRFPDPDGRFAGGASSLGREVVQDALFQAGGDRVAIYDLENDEGTPIYVHSKACIVDDLWLAVGSDNLNRRSWTHDSEISCAILDSRLDEREPADPAGRGEGARRLARATRVRLSAEHAGVTDDDADSLIDPRTWFETMRLRAEALDAWCANGNVGPRPAGHLRRHPRDRVEPARRRVLWWVHANVLDPDGRPRALRRRDEL